MSFKQRAWARNTWSHCQENLSNENPKFQQECDNLDYNIYNLLIQPLKVWKILKWQYTWAILYDN